MKKFQRISGIKPVSWFLVCWLTFFLPGNLPVSSAPAGAEPGREDLLRGLFQWADMDYRCGKYREVTNNLEFLLSFFDETDPVKEKNKSSLLKGKIYLLLGAAYERLGRLQKAKENYLLSKNILENHQVSMKIDGIDFDYLEEYQRVIMNNKSLIVKQGVIEKPALNKKKKRAWLLSVVGSVVLAGGIAAVLLLNKKRPIDIDQDPDYDSRVLGIDWVPIPAGEFIMGDNFNEGNFDELPTHAVYLDEYYISRYEITFEQFDKFCEETKIQKPTDSEWGRGNRPVVNISWRDAQAFCEWLSQKTLKKIRLPTEAQWEKAARGTDQRRFPWGNSPADCSKVNYDCDTRTHPVGSHPDGVSPYGVHDMAGNVSEWCRDEYSALFYSRSLYRNPVNMSMDPMGETKYVLRGGSWERNDPEWENIPKIRSADRGYGNFYYGVSGRNDTRTNTIGFRLVLVR